MILIQKKKLWQEFVKYPQIPDVTKNNVIRICDPNIQEGKKSVYSELVALVKQEIWRDRCAALYGDSRKTIERMFSNLQMCFKDLYVYNYYAFNYKERKKKWGLWFNKFRYSSNQLYMAFSFAQDTN